MNVELVLHPIGIIRTPFKNSDGVPIQSSKSNELGQAEVDFEYVEGLRSLDGFSHIFLLYWFHKSKNPKMEVKPFLDTKTHGLFSTRAPTRPNPIGFSIVEIDRIVGNVIHFRGADMLDETPLLDIKPFVPEFDNRPEATSGWLAASKIRKNHDYQSDERFEKGSQ